MKALPLALFLSFSHATTSLLAQSGDTADEAELQFELGARDYQSGDFLRALEHFLVSNRLSPNHNVAFNIARTYEKLSRFPEAYRYYQQALRGTWSEEDRAELLRAVALLEKFVVVLDVKTAPEGAILYVDRVELGPRGEAPRKLGLSPGKYTIIARKQGYEEAHVEIPALSLGERKEIALTLKPLLGTVVVTGANLEGARVSTDLAGSGYECTAPCELSLPPGAVTIRVERPGFRKVESVVEVQPEHRHRVLASLEPSTGALVVRADEVGALVEVDEKPVGFTPALIKVPVGKHSVRVVHPGSVPYEREITIEEDATHRLQISFERVNEVVAASRRSESVLDAPSSVSIIPREELTLFAYPTISEALRGVQGLYQWNDRAYPSLGVRGIGRLGSYGNRVLVLNDDHPTNDNWVGSSYVSFDGRTDLADVERIEIVRGPGSVLFGTNAIAGVVNVVSRDVGEGNQTEAGLSAVSDGVGRARLRQDVRLGPQTTIWSSVGVASGDGTSFVLPGSTPGESIATERRADRLTAATVQSRFEHKAFSVSAFGHTHEKHQPTGWFETIPGDPRARQRDSRAYIDARFEPEVTKELSNLSRVHLNYYGYRGVFPREPADGGVESDRFSGSWVGLEQRFVYAPSSTLSVTLGAEGQYHFLMDQSAGDSEGLFLDERHELLVGAGYGMVDLFFPKVRLSAGARFDAYSTFGSSLNPRLAAVTSPYSEGTTKVILGKAFRAPSIYELYYADGGFTQVASPNLRPEEAWSVEVEHLHQFTKTVSASFGIFANRITDLVTSVGQGSAVEPIEYVNSDKPLAAVGIETRLRREWGQGWMAEAGYTLQTAAFLESDDLSDLFAWNRSDVHRNVANVPAHLLSAKGAVPILGSALTLGSRFTAESPRETTRELTVEGNQSSTDPFFIWDVVLSGREGDSGLSYSFGVYNAADNRYELPLSAEFPQATFPQPGRTFLAQLGLTL